MENLSYSRDGLTEDEIVASAKAASAVKWIEEHAEEYGGDSSNIFLSGESAGGQLALLYTGLVSSGKLDAPLPNAVCVMYPAIDLRWTSENGRYFSSDTIPGIVETYIGGSLQDYEDRLAAVDPMNYISDKFPPVLIIHGKKDSLVTIAGSEKFVDNPDLILVRHLTEGCERILSGELTDEEKEEGHIIYEGLEIRFDPNKIN